MALPTIDTILYTTSLGKHTRPVFKQAVNLANSLNAKIIMLHVIEPIGEMGAALIQNYLPDDMLQKLHNEGLQEIHNQMRERIVKFCDEELSDLDTQPKLDIEYVVVEGNHTATILNQAKQHDAQLIVMGAENTFGHHSNTTQQVIRKAKIPVVVVPTGKKFS